MDIASSDCMILLLYLSCTCVSKRSEQFRVSSLSHAMTGPTLPSSFVISPSIDFCGSEIEAEIDKTKNNYNVEVTWRNTNFRGAVSYFYFQLRLILHHRTWL
jgi:hypothetical protein